MLLVDRTNNRVSVLVLCPSVCRLSVYLSRMYGKVRLAENCLKKQIGNGLWGIECSRD